MLVERRVMNGKVQNYAEYCLQGNILTVKLESEADIILDSSAGAQGPDRVHTAEISPS